MKPPHFITVAKCSPFMHLISMWTANEESTEDACILFFDSEEWSKLFEQDVPKQEFDTIYLDAAEKRTFTASMRTIDVLFALNKLQRVHSTRIEVVNFATNDVSKRDISKELEVELDTEDIEEESDVSDNSSTISQAEQVSSGDKK